MEKNETKQINRLLNEPPKLSLREEIGSSIIHGIGAILSIPAFVFMLLSSDTGLKIMASCFYGITLFLLMLMSCLYHAFKRGSTVKRVWRRFEYVSIYLFIGGTFAPLFLIELGNTLGVVLFCVQWLLIIIGTVFISVFGPGRIKLLQYILYFGMGASIIIFFPSWIMNNISLFCMMLCSIALYLLGLIPLKSTKKYTHMLWHVFVVVATAIQWCAIYHYIY